MKIKKIAQTPGFVGTIVDNLNSESSVDALSAKQGKILNEKIENIDGGSSVEIVDNLTTEDATKALAAKQGVVLKELIDNKGAGIAISDTPPTDEKYEFWLDTSVDDSILTLEDVYSTQEVKTNKIWIDGKPIYRKVVTLSNVTNASNIIPYDISTCDKVWLNGGESFYDASSSTKLPINFQSGSNYIKSHIGSSGIQFDTTAWHGGTAYFVVEYTKLSD